MSEPDENQKIPVKEVKTGPKTRIEKPKSDKYDSKAPRSRIYVRAVEGVYQVLRKRMNWVMMVAFMALPWIQFEGRQAVLFEIAERQFHIFGLTIWPQDFMLLAFVFMIAAFALFFFTTFLGRVWCGYTCPQTVWTFIFIWFEEKIEGPRNKRMRLDQLPWDLNKFWRKTLKHTCWVAFSLFTALTFVAYFSGSVESFIGFFTGDMGGGAYFWVIFFTAATYGNAGWLRETVCLHMCPYARFQSVMFDRDTFTVSYDVKRGESRGPRSRKADPAALGLGDCIDCYLCVQVCPTGIDIRNGLQYECINCGACVDACDTTMERMGYDKGLISYTTERQLEGGNTKITRPKLIGYGFVLVAMIGVFIMTAVTRSPLGLDVIRDRNMLSRTTNEGLIENVYTLKLLNKSQQEQTYQLSVEGLEEVRWTGDQTVVVANGEIFNLPISLAVDPYLLEQPITDIEFILTDSENRQVRQESRFIKGR
ncbi:cytochrome c oxidase accessory protein CcoG [Echinimonas agarilytica]|uniref:Cytochrome c oxidase accessory protein CcoG n=1 Tax=Echinimonas agarilytica TaxID=1215918 RepID=A0AA41W3K9_9GAMM|nr:cytochrome c oxidase accessory protein CcoG [Echinimonas agarilytica]MCM2678186.1 cytochrome c oxidase accessory protein CcoG [Echinimonas agarilytica]